MAYPEWASGRGFRCVRVGILVLRPDGQGWIPWAPGFVQSAGTRGGAHCFQAVRAYVVFHGRLAIAMYHAGRFLLFVLAHAAACRFCCFGDMAWRKFFVRCPLRRRRRGNGASSFGKRPTRLEYFVERYVFAASLPRVGRRADASRLGRHDRIGGMVLQVVLARARIQIWHEIKNFVSSRSSLAETVRFLNKMARAGT